MSSTTPTPERWYEKHAWILIFTSVIVPLPFALLNIITGNPPAGDAVQSVTGMTWEELVAASPKVADLISLLVRVQGGLYLMGLAIFGVAISLNSYKRAEKWAWYVLWYLPVVFALVAAIDLSVRGIVWPLLTVLAIISLLGLLLPYRKFFPKNQTATPHQRQSERES